MPESSFIDWDTLVCFTKGLIEVAKVDGMQPREVQFMEAFFKEEVSRIKGKESSEFKDLYDYDFDLEEARKHLKSAEIKDYFFKSCVMLACVDSFSNDEKILISNFARELNYSEDKLNKVIDEVQKELLAQFSDITIYADSLKEVAASIGVQDPGN